MRAILALYMTEKLGVDKADAGTFMSLFIAACYFFPLIGGYLADNFFGKYWTIVGFSVPYVLAQFLVGIEDRYVVFGALCLLAMGSGVIKPNISTLMGLTYDQQRPGQDQLRTSAFNWFYMSINIGAALSQFAMPWLRTNYGYQTAFLFPAGLMALALGVFAAGKRFYAQEKIERKIIGDPNSAPPPDTTTLTGVPVKYKVVTPDEKQEDYNLKINTLARIGSVFLLVMFFWAIFDQAASTWIFFADTYMNTNLFGVETSADAIQGFNPVFIIILVPISVWLFKTLDRAGWKVKATQKMVVGFFLTAVAMGIMSVSGFLAEAKQTAVKLTTPEGVLILPNWEGVELNKVAKDPQGAAVTHGKGVQVSATDFDYDTDKKKLSFANGKLILADGKEVQVKDGHLLASDLTSSGLIAGGVLEPLLKPAKQIEGISKEAARITVETIDWVRPEGRVTVWWQVLAYLILTVAEILISVTGLELAFVAAPQSMKSFVTACWLAVVFLANLLINAPITRLYPLMNPGEYFAMLGVAMIVVLGVFIPVSANFNRAMEAAKTQVKPEDTEVV